MNQKNFVPIGEIVPLQAQLHDGALDVSIVVIVFDPNGAQLETVSLAHIENGLYIANTFKMPDTEYIRAQYLTNKPDEYEIVSDLFYSSPRVEAQKTFHIGEVISSEKKSEIYEGQLVERNSL